MSEPRPVRSPVTVLAVLVIALLVMIAVAGTLFYVSQKDVPGISRATAHLVKLQQRQLDQQGEIIRSLQAANVAQDQQSHATAGLLAATLDLLADNFETPPAPDARRLKAVQGLRDEAAAICASLPEPKPLGCPPPG